jgi:hypothetical protein
MEDHPDSNMMCIGKTRDVWEKESHDVQYLLIAASQLLAPDQAGGICRTPAASDQTAR